MSTFFDSSTSCSRSDPDSTSEYDSSTSSIQTPFFKFFKSHLAIVSNLITVLFAVCVFCVPRIHRQESAPVRRLNDVAFSPPSQPVDIPDHIFGILPGRPIPVALVRRLVDLESSGPRKRLQSVAMYGGIYDYAYYFVSVLVGTPPQRQSVIVDSGSSLLAFPCRNCRDCGHEHMDSGFDFARSSTARWLSCHDPQCITGRCGLGEVCPYQQSYSEGSSIEGSYFSDLVALGEQRSNNSFVRFDHIGCHDRETNLFVSQKASGILGVAYPKRGKQETLIDALFKSPEVDTKVFAICAAEEGGLMNVGGYDSSFHRPSRTVGSSTLRLLGLSQSLRFNVKTRQELLPDNASSFTGDLEHEPVSQLRRLLEESNNTVPTVEEPVKDVDVLAQQHEVVDGASISVAWTPVTSTTTYQIDVLEMLAVTGDGDTVGTQIATGSDVGHGVVDSGTTFSYLAPRAFAAFMSVLKASCSSKTSSFCLARNNLNSDMCWSIETLPMLDLLPSFLFKLQGGATVEWKAHSYLHRRARTKVWCAAVDDNKRSNSIFGMSFMKQKNVIFDRERDLIGFADADCPTVPDTSRPPPPTFALPSEGSTTVTRDEGGAVALATSIPDEFEVEKSSMDNDEIGDDASLLWSSAGLFMGIGIVAMGAITIKTLRGRPQEYQPMDIHRNQPEDLEMAEQNSEPSWEERGGHGQLRNDSIEDEAYNPQQYDAIEAELDQLEKATRV